MEGAPGKLPQDAAPEQASGGSVALRVLLALVLFLSAAGALVLEIVAGRMVAPYVGMSLYTWTAVISVVLAGLSVGHWLGGLLSDVAVPRACARLALLFTAAGLTAGAALPLIRMTAPAILALGMTPVLAITVLAATLFFLPSLFVGAVSPILTKIAVTARPDVPGRSIGLMYAAGAAGSILGTLAAGFLFISWIGTTGTVLSVAGLYLVLAVGCAIAARPLPASALAAAAVVLAAGLAVTLAGAHVGALTSPCRVESDYYCIRVVDLSAEIERPAALMVLDHLGHGINDRDDPTRLHTPYLALVDRLLRQRMRPERGFSAFFIGGGANTLPRAWQARYPQARLVVSEVDPAVTRVAQEAMWFRPGANLVLDHRDARVALADTVHGERFDVIVGDAFHDISVPQHLTTAEFAALLRARLGPQGFYALNVVDSSSRPLFLYAVARTLRTAFAEVEVWIDASQVRASERITYLVVAAAQPSGIDELDDGGEPSQLWFQWPQDDLGRRLVGAHVPVLTDDYAPVDRLMLHVPAEDR